MRRLPYIVEFGGGATERTANLERCRDHLITGGINAVMHRRRSGRLVWEQGEYRLYDADVKHVAAWQQELAAVGVTVVVVGMPQRKTLPPAAPPQPPSTPAVAPRATTRRDTERFWHRFVAALSIRTFTPVLRRVDKPERYGLHVPVRKLAPAEREAQIAEIERQLYDALGYIPEPGTRLGR